MPSSRARPIPLAEPPATIYLVRHAEKLKDGRIHLSPLGLKRAAALPRLFAPSNARPTALAIPQAIFATRQSARSDRPVQTVRPLAEALRLPIDNSIWNKDYDLLARELLSGSYAGKVVLVAWHRGTLPQLTMALGAKPPYARWPENQFDRIWRFDYKAGKRTLIDLPQALLPRDSK